MQNAILGFPGYFCSGGDDRNIHRPQNSLYWKRPTKITKSNFEVNGPYVVVAPTLVLLAPWSNQLT